MKIGICNDHAGVDYKNRLVEYLTGKGYEMVNFGTDTTDSMDYPDVAHPLAAAVESGEVDLGISMMTSAMIMEAIITTIVDD